MYVFLIAFDQHTDHVTAGWIMGCARHWGAARLGFATNSIEAEGKVLLCGKQVFFFFFGVSNANLLVARISTYHF